jgi:hypothetical protein
VKQLPPRKVRVFGVDVPINYIKQPILEGVEVDGFYHAGKIEIKDSLNPELMKETALHEVIHAVDAVMETKCSERQVNQVARGLHGVLNDSPEFKKFLLEVDA